MPGGGGWGRVSLQDYRPPQARPGLTVPSLGLEAPGEDPCVRI